jgi:hypothetical protein
MSAEHTNIDNSLQSEVQISKITVENSNQNEALISIQSGFSELVFDRQTFEWHENQEYLNLLRVRFVLCMSDQNAAPLDYIAQRFSEYQEKNRLRATPINPNDRNLNLEQMYRVTTVNLLGGENYLENRDRLRQIDNNMRINEQNRKDYLLGSEIPFRVLGGIEPPPTVYPYQNVSPSITYARPLFYNNDERLRDLITYDAPLNDLLSRDSEGNPSLTQERVDVSNPNGRGYYVRQNCTLKDINIKVGEGHEYTDNNFDHLSISAFVYLDMDAYNQQYNLDPVENPNAAASSVFYLGMGPILSKTYLGQKTIFEPIEITSTTNEEGSTVYKTTPQTIGPTVTNVVDAPAANNFDDLRSRISDRQIFQNPNDPLYTEFLSFREQINQSVYRTISSNTIGRQNLKIIKKNNYFTDLWLSKDNQDNVRYCFGFDLQKYMASNAIFPSLYSNASSYSELMNDKDRIIKNVTVKRRKLDQEGYNNTNDLGTYGKEKIKTISSENPEYIIDTPSHRRHAAFLNLDNQNERDQTSILFYSGYDQLQNDAGTAPVQERLSLRQVTGKFQYSVSFTIEDISLNYVVTRLNDIKAAQKQIQEALSVHLNSIGLYNIVTNRLIVSNENMRILMGLVDRYVGILQDFGVGELAAEASIMLNRLLASLRPGAYSEIEKIFGELVVELSTLLANNYGDFETIKDTKVHIGSRGLYESSIPLSTVDHSFEENVEYGFKNGFGVDYFNGAYGGGHGPLQISGRDFLQRAEKEFQKYFYRPENPEEGLTFSQGSYDNPGISYFSPRLIFRPGKEPIDQLYYFPFDKQNIAEYNLNEYAELLVDIIDAQYRTKYLNFIFYNNQDNNAPSNRAKSILMENESCAVLEQELAEFSVPRPNTRPDVFRVDLERLNLVTQGLVPGILGGLNLSPVDRAFIDEREQSDLNLDVIQPAIDDVLDLDPRQASNPVKLIYNIFGELELNAALPSQSDDESVFNSFTNLRENLQLTTNNLNRRLSSVEDLGFLPNQLKSMLVMSTTEQQTLLEGIFDARRVYLQDRDFANPMEQNVFSDDKISFYAPRTGDSNPPFSITEDPMKIYAKFLSFWLNYKQLCVVEYLSGFGDLIENSTAPVMVEAVDTPGGPRPIEEGQMFNEDEVVLAPEYVTMGFDNVLPKQPLGNVPSILRKNIPKRPIWKTLNREALNAIIDAEGAMEVMCRVRSLVNSDLLQNSENYQDSDVTFMPESPAKLDMQIYNEYFFLTNHPISLSVDQVPYSSAASQVPAAVAERRQQLELAGQDTPVAAITRQTEGVGRFDAETLMSPQLASNVSSPTSSPGVSPPQGNMSITLPRQMTNLSRAASVVNISRQNIGQIGRNLVYNPRGSY